MRVLAPKHPPVVYIEWEDTATLSQLWEDREETLAKAGAFLAPITAAGFLLADDPRGVILALLYNDHNDDVGQTIVIPRSAIRKMRVILKGHGFTLDPEATLG